MVTDARQLPESEHIETDVCIVGAGAAGITIAREFARHSLRVCLVESGGRAFARRTQSLYRGQNRGTHYWPLVQSRVRRYGGSTTHWDGQCRPLDAIDFEAREWLPHSGWPFAKTTLDPYYARAAAVCQLDGVPDFDSTPAGRTVLFAANSGLATPFFYYGRALNFAEMYGGVIEAAENINLLLHANITEAVTTADAGRVIHLQARTLSGNAFAIVARHFVLAAGGIENARLLLASNQTQPAGLGNQHDVVGRYLMNHPAQFFAVLESSPSCPPLDVYVKLYNERHTVKGAWAFSERLLRREQLVNCSVYVTPRAAFKSTPAYLSPAMGSLNMTLEALRLGNAPDDVNRHLRQMLGGLGAIGASFGRKLLNRSPQLALRIMLENAPNPDSRVTLATQRDALGQNRASVNWQLSNVDWRSYRHMIRSLQAEFERTGFGRVDPFFDPDGEPWPLPVQNGAHHMGATRMHLDPRQGVVDDQGCVHGIPNLAIAGSSVFPTSGHANPTFTIVALALRLADHLKRVVT